MSSTKYVPPALRNKNRGKRQEDEQPKTPALPTPAEFPALVSSPDTNRSWKPQKSFAVLATEWNEHAEDEKMREEYRQAMERRDAEIRERDMRSVVVLRRQMAVDDYDEDDAADEMEAPIRSTDEWVTVERKVRRELTDEEKQARQEAQEAEELERRKREDTVWNSGNGDEWDYRDRRVNN